jgi:hypothetical protein
MKKLSIVRICAVLLSAWACSDSASPPNDDDTRPPSGLNILTLAQGTPPLVTDSVGFWAVYDDDREGRIDIAPDLDYLKFRVREFSLLRRPDGTLFGPGDSIFISIKVVNPDSLLFEFSPTGLEFNPAEPAELSIDYDHAGSTIVGDFDGDGDSDEDDADIELNLFVWQQENPGDMFLRLATLVEVSLDEVKADIVGFTRYALAY